MHPWLMSKPEEPRLYLRAESGERAKPVNGREDPVVTPSFPGEGFPFPLTLLPKGDDPRSDVSETSF